MAPPLRLSPASLGANLALQQQLTAMVGSQTHRMELLLEVDSQAVRLAVLNLGQTAARLEWDGEQLTQSRAAWWPQAVTAQRILDDLQLTLWPAEAIRAALPAGWSLASSATLRVLSREGEPVVRVRYQGPYASELEHLREGYRVRVESRVLEAAP
ncbi:MAG TPA: DUF3261 domain-containing protein [Ramlibacter sp.]|nr:DUF3261 domain-containing protein [Ramlibacter sp.]